jgi:hypothetical protein
MISKDGEFVQWYKELDRIRAVRRITESILRILKLLGSGSRAVNDVPYRFTLEVWILQYFGCGKKYAQKKLNLETLQMHGILITSFSVGLEGS